MLELIIVCIFALSMVLGFLTLIHNHRHKDCCKDEPVDEKSTSTKKTLEQELDDILEKHHLQ